MHHILLMVAISYKGQTLTWYFLQLSEHTDTVYACLALESCRHAGEGLPSCPVMRSGSSGAANANVCAGEQYQVRVRVNPYFVLNKIQVTGHTHNTRTTTQPNTRKKKHTTEPLSSDRRLREKEFLCYI